MNTFQLNDMTCGRCASTIRPALAAVDPEAKVSIDVAARRVAVDSARADAARLKDAIERAGYTTVAVEPCEQAAGTPKRGGYDCGCGCG